MTRDHFRLEAESALYILLLHKEYFVQILPSVLHPSTSFCSQVQTNSCNILHPWNESWKMTLCVRLNVNQHDLTSLIHNITTSLSLWEKQETTRPAYEGNIIFSSSSCNTLCFHKGSTHQKCSQGEHWYPARVIGSGFSCRTANLFLLTQCFCRTLTDSAELGFIKRPWLLSPLITAVCGAPHSQGFQTLAISRVHNTEYQRTISWLGNFTVIVWIRDNLSLSDAPGSAVKCFSGNSSFFFLQRGLRE